MYEREITQLQEVAGSTLKIDRDALSAGALIVECDWPVEGKTVPLRAIYPDGFPRIRPIVSLRINQEKYPLRHCSPIEGVLCLLGRDGRQWPHQWTLRRLLDEQLADSLSGNGEEDRQGEPAEYWWNLLSLADSYCLIDSDWTTGAAKSGTLKMAFHATWGDQRPLIKGAVIEIRDGARTSLGAWTGPLPQELTQKTAMTVDVPWVRLEGTFIPNGRPEQISQLAEDYPDLFTGRTMPLNLTNHGRCFAIAYESELGFQKHGLAWLFPFLYGTKKRVQQRDRRKSPRLGYLRTLRGGESDIGRRVPAVGCLRGKSIALFGLGAIGAPLAVDLARNGCSRLHLVDYDVVEPGNAIRWILGASAWGQQKTDALAAFIAREYPWAVPVPHNHNIGNFADPEGGVGDDTLFAAALESVDLVVDATASYGVTCLIGDHCRERGLPLISLFATPNVTGGVVARYEPHDGCPTCLEFAWNQELIEPAPGLRSEEGLQQPPGCSERTFTGGSYDLQELALEAMRLIADTLGTQAEQRHSTVRTLSLAAAGERIPPSWKADPLPKAQGCSCGR